MPKFHMLTVAMLKKGTTVETIATPDTSYVETSQLHRNKLDFAKLRTQYMRVVISAVGDEAGNNKGIELYDVTGGQALCDVTWNGNTNQTGLAGAWTNTNIPTADSVITMRFKGSSATENLSVYQVDFQLIYT